MRRKPSVLAIARAAGQVNAPNTPAAVLAVRSPEGLMNEPRYDVIAIGNAIVDVMAPCDDELIDELQLNRGGMTLVDTAGRVSCTTRWARRARSRAARRPTR